MSVSISQIYSNFIQSHSSKISAPRSQTFRLKGSVSRDFRPKFFSWFDPSRPLINGLKSFWIWLRFRRAIQIFKKLCSMHHTAESDSAVCIILQSQTLRCVSHHRVMKTKYLNFFLKALWCALCNVHPTAESDSVVCILPWSQAPWCASHRVVSNLVSILIRNFTIVIYLRYLNKLLWKLSCESQIV